MKKLLLSLAVVVLAGGAAVAQHQPMTPSQPAAGAQHEDQSKNTTSSTLIVDDMAFNEETHDFGTVPEGPAAEVEFKFKNTGKEPIVIQSVRPSCGCTTPSYSKEPVKPGETGVIKASYATSSRPGGFNKAITVTSNAGTKMLFIKGEVEPAPQSSVPQNSSMMKTH